MRLLALDPGIDRTGYAVFEIRTRGRVVTFNDCLDGLIEAGELETNTADELQVRLASLGLQVRNLVVGWEPDVVFVETPSFHGSYTGGPERRKGVNKLYQAIGAILCRLGALAVCVQALTEPKPSRLKLLAAAAEIVGLELPCGPRGGRREDAWDAIWLGCQAVTNGLTPTKSRKRGG